MMAAVHSCARPEHRIYGVVALAFVTLMAGTTSIVHFVELTALRQLGSRGIVWPSPIYAVELLAWNLFLRLSLLFAAPVFASQGLERAVRRGLQIWGLLCVAGVVGPAVGDMRLQLVGVFGYTVVLPAVSLMLAWLFRGAQRGVGASMTYQRRMSTSPSRLTTLLGTQGCGLRGSRSSRPWPTSS